MANICYKKSNSCDKCSHFRYDADYGRRSCYLGAKDEILDWCDLAPELQAILRFKHRGDSRKPIEKRNFVIKNGKIIIL